MDAELPSLRHLRMFEAVARLESVGRAASEVSRSQPALTQALAKLERIVGVELFERRHSGSYLTDFGRILLLRTQRLLDAIERALTEPVAGSRLIEKARLGSVLSRLTTNHLQCIVALTEVCSGSGDEPPGGITLRTVQRSVREIEKILDRRIMRQASHGKRMTPIGAELARRFCLALKEMEYAREEIAAALGEAQATISIGAMPQCATLVLTLAIDEFTRVAPSARIKIESGPYDLLLGDLRLGKIDFLFGLLRKPEWVTDICEEPLFEAPYAIVVRRRHPLTKRRSVTLDDFASYDWILPQQGTPRRLAFDRIFQSAKVKPQACIETNKSDLQLALIEISDRMTIMSANEAERLVEKGTLAILDYRPPVSRRLDGVATRKEWHPTEASSLFIKILREQSRHACRPVLDATPVR